MIFGTLLTTGCRKDNDSTIFTAVTPNYGGAKDYVDGATVFWSDGDAVHVNNGIFTVAVSDGDRHRATINAEGISDMGGEYFAAYPADIASITNADHITFSLPQTENYIADGDRQVIHSVMAAKANNHTFPFQNICALLHFKACSNVSGAKIRAVEVVTDRPLWGTIATEYSTGQWHVTSVTGTGNTSRTLRFDTPLTLNSTPQDIYLVVPPVSNARTFTLRLTIDDGTIKVFEKSKEGTFSFASGYLYHFDDINTYTSSGMKFGSSDPVATVTDGSEEHPYLVYSSENWTNLASTMTTAKHIALANDISVSSTLSGNFKAILDGNGHTVTLTTPNISLFSTIERGTVKNLTLAATSDVTSPKLIDNNGGEDRYYGTLACRAVSSSTFDNCVNTINIKCDTTRSKVYIGGLFGYTNNSSITNCVNNGDILTNALHVGGIAGYANNSIAFSGCTNTGDITIKTISGVIFTIDIGGIAGYLSCNSVTTNCHNSGNINILNPSTASVSYYGGVFGQTTSFISQCSNSGNIHCGISSNNEKYFGGIIGAYLLTSTPKNLSNCYNEGNITATESINKMTTGGIIGMNNRMSILNCYAFCNLEGTYVAGISAYGRSINLGDVTISNCYYFGIISCVSSNYYGIAGESSNTNHFIIDHCYYPSSYPISVLSGTYASTANNDSTLSNATTLETGGRLSEALNANINNMPEGCYRWKNSTSTPIHVVFDN